MPAIAPRQKLEKTAISRDFGKSSRSATSIGELWAGRVAQVKNRLSIPLSEFPMAAALQPIVGARAPSATSWPSLARRRRAWKAALKRADLTYEELAARLKKHGFKESKASQTFEGDRIGPYFPCEPSCNRMRGRHTGGYLIGPLALRRITEGSFALGSVIVFALWLLVVLPFLYSAPSHKYDRSPQHTTDAGGSQHKPKEPFWERATDDPVAVFTLALVVFTFVLAFSTIGLWIVTARGVGNQRRDTEILQRAYISVEPGGIGPTSDGAKCIANIEICNVGHLPARNVKWAIHYAIDENHRRPKDQLAITRDLEGENTLPPGGRMIQGGELIYVGAGENELKPRLGLYLYVWGVVVYDDGFSNRRDTFFCHRYNCVNLYNIEPDVSAPMAFRYGAAAMIDRKAARYHRFGNEAT